MKSERHGRLTDKRRLARHGTNGGYMRHWRKGEDACELCKKAHSTYEIWRLRTTPEERKAWTFKVRERKVSDND